MTHLLHLRAASLTEFEAVVRAVRPAADAARAAVAIAVVDV